MFFKKKKRKKNKIDLELKNITFQTPDSPMWLLSKGEVDKAKSTLKRLRGGASDEKCDAEFQDMVRYASEMKPDGHQKGYHRKPFVSSCFIIIDTYRSHLSTKPRR
jgi:hypothetical protein